MAKLTRAEIFSACGDHVRHKKIFNKTPPPLVQKQNQGPVIKYTEQGNPVRVWASQLDTNAWNQAKEFADLSFVHPKGLALMPDVHVGKDVPVGSVLPTVGAIVPAAVGVDIGCGMMAARLNLTASQLPDHLAKVRRLIEQRVPLSSGGRHKEISDALLKAWAPLQAGSDWIKHHHPRAHRPHAIEQLGTLGSGNHFIEICLDESKQVWVMLHSGSRGAGSMVGQFFIDQALRRCRENGTHVGNLGWFMEEDPLFQPYITSLEWAQDFAQVNRQCMMDATLAVLSEVVGRPVVATQHAINCHHNYVAREHHGGTDVWVTRKGAIRARKGDWGIIPSAMGQESFIVEGLGEEQSWCSCAHGAGRVMSRTAAQKRFTSKDLKEQTKGVECRKDKMVVDEIPSSYKPIKSVMDDQKDLVVIRHRIKAVICIKGV